MFFFTWINFIETSDHRSKRFLTFPRTSPTRIQVNSPSISFKSEIQFILIAFQLIMGIGVPVDLEIESVTIGWVNKVEYFLPENASNYLNFLSDPFDLTTRLIYAFYDRKKRQVVVDEPTEKPDLSNEIGYDSEQNEKFEKHEAEAKVIESGTEKAHESEDMTEAEYWNQEDRADWFRKIHPKRPKNMAKSRWAIYKNMAMLAER